MCSCYCFFCCFPVCCLFDSVFGHKSTATDTTGYFFAAMGDTITASSASSAATALLPAAQLTRSIDKGTTSKDGRQLSLQVYKEDMEQVVDLEKVLQELIQLQLLYTNTVAPLKESLVEPVEVNVGARNESPDIKLNTIQLIYRILVQLTTTVNDLAQSNETASVVLLYVHKLLADV